MIEKYAAKFKEDLIAVADSIPKPVSLSQAFLYWLKLGFISFGGPAGQIAIIHHDLVEKKRWLSEKRFLHALNYCMVYLAQRHNN